MLIDWLMSKHHMTERGAWVVTAGWTILFTVFFSVYVLRPLHRAWKRWRFAHPDLGADGDNDRRDAEFKAFIAEEQSRIR